MELARVVDADVELARVVVELELEVGRRGGGDGGGGRRLLRPLLGHVAGIDTINVGVVFACRARILRVKSKLLVPTRLPMNYLSLEIINKI